MAKRANGTLWCVAQSAASRAGRCCTPLLCPGGALLGHCAQRWAPSLGQTGNYWESPVEGMEMGEAWSPSWWGQAENRGGEKAERGLSSTDGYTEGGGWEEGAGLGWGVPREQREGCWAQTGAVDQWLGSG